jgi:hypothetical protein
VSGAFEQLDRLSVVVERIPGQHDNIGSDLPRHPENFWQYSQAIPIAETIVST